MIDSLKEVIIINYYSKIKKELINNEIYKKAKDYRKNRSDLNTYFNVGKLLIEAQGGETRAKYGDNLIKKYSDELTKELGNGYTVSALKRMRQFYLIVRIGATMSHLLSWSHYTELLSINDINQINYYIKITEEQKLSVRELRYRIKNKEYECLDEIVKEKLINKEESKIEDFIKNPIVIRNSQTYEKISEKLLKQLILEDLDNFLKELGEGFLYAGNEYKLKLGDRYNYIDILLFNIKYNCYVVVELKVTELKAEYIGQVKKYIGYIDKNVKTINQNDTIGIIICKRENQYVMQYCSDPRIFETTYILK